MINTVGVHHTFNAAHRLPHLGGKGASLHGHTWRAEIAFGSDQPLGPAGVITEAGLLEHAVRGWVDVYLDHCALLGAADTLADAVRKEGKVVRFGLDPLTVQGAISEPEALAAGLLWPTAENVATLLSRMGDQIAGGISAHLYVQRVLVHETDSNFAEWTRSAPPASSTYAPLPVYTPGPPVVPGPVRPAAATTTNTTTATWTPEEVNKGWRHR